MHNGHRRSVLRIWPDVRGSRCVAVLRLNVVDAHGIADVAVGFAFQQFVEGQQAQIGAKRQQLQAQQEKLTKGSAIGDTVGPAVLKDIVALALKYREELGFHIASKGEMAAFIAFAQAFPKNLLCLVDTYDTLNSGVPNYICVALALLECGYEPRGIRLDSGDLAYLSKEARKLMACVYGLRRVGRPPHPLSVLASTTLPPSPRAAPRTPSTARSWRRATLWRATTSTRRCC